MSNEKRKPTFTICVNDTPQGAKPAWRNIGAAWETEKGNLFIKIDEGEVLRGTAMMFPYRERASGSGYRKSYARPTMRPSVPPSTSPPPYSGAEDDYMERKRQERQRKPQPPAQYPAGSILPVDSPLSDPLNHDGDCPDPEAPDWL